MRDPEISLQAILLYMSLSHHSFYSNHIRHQLSDMEALWELPGTAQHILTLALWRPVTFQQTKHTLKWLYLLIYHFHALTKSQLCIELQILMC